MIDFSELQDVDFGDLSTWPDWFRWAMTGVLGLVILIAGYNFVVRPQQGVLTELEQEERQFKEIFLEKKEKTINLPAYKEQLQEIRNRFGIVLNQLPSRAEVPAMLIDISQAGFARGLQFEQLMPDSPKEKQFYKIIPVSIKVSGKFHQFIEFISDLASLPRVVTMGDMSIKRIQGSDQLIMEAQLRTYQYLEKSTSEKKG